MLSFWQVDFIVFMKWYLIYIVKTLNRLTAPHALPARSQEVTDALHFISGRTVQNTGLSRPKDFVVM
jgi:hypothetical protein